MYMYIVVCYGANLGQKVCCHASTMGTLSLIEPYNQFMQTKLYMRNRTSYLSHCRVYTNLSACSYALIPCLHYNI